MEGKGKKGNKRSEVWDHFKIRGDEKAECNYCGQTYKHHAKNCGTSTLWNHITQLCKRYPYRGQDKKQKRMTGYSMYTTGELSKGVGSRKERVNFVQKDAREQITRSSPKRLKRFKEICKEASIEPHALLCLDVINR
ncbi:Ribonuclease H-like domain containing protein [Abeliophyllum distichum]|uniref:Ribonuclease H-like domain containing protein n=1 Tax=Abeliophyllum distichum TaxID=126358 RepID=A0ABD1SAR2_9LAMI